MVDKKRDSMEEYVKRLVEPIFKEALKNTMGVSKDGGSVKIYWRPNNYRLLIPFSKLTFRQQSLKEPSFPMEHKISNYGSKNIFKIKKGITIVIDKNTATLHYSSKDDRGNKLYYELEGSIEEFENKLNKEVENIKNTLFLKLKEIIRCYGGSADFDNADWLKYEDGNIGDEFCDSLPENRIIYANTFKKVYKDEIEFTGKKGEYPTTKLVNYIDNQALERQTPKIMEELKEIKNEKQEFQKALADLTIQLKEHLGAIHDIRASSQENVKTSKSIRKYISAILGIKKKSIKKYTNQEKLIKWI